MSQKRSKDLKICEYLDISCRSHPKPMKEIDCKTSAERYKLCHLKPGASIDATRPKVERNPGVKNAFTKNTANQLYPEKHGNKSKAFSQDNQIQAGPNIERGGDELPGVASFFVGPIQEKHSNRLSVLVPSRLSLKCLHKIQLL